MPLFKFSMRSSFTSRAMTRFPRSAKHAPVTRPTYPTPTTQICFIYLPRKFVCEFLHKADWLNIPLYQLSLVFLPFSNRIIQCALDQPDQMACVIRFWKISIHASIESPLPFDGECMHRQRDH